MLALYVSKLHSFKLQKGPIAPLTEKLRWLEAQAFFDYGLGETIPDGPRNSLICQASKMGAVQAGLPSGSAGMKYD